MEAPRGAVKQLGLGLLLLCNAIVCSHAASGGVCWPLPEPANGKCAHPVPPGVYEWKPRALEGPLAANTRLRSAVRLFDGKVVGAESVVVGPSGQLVMLDRYNQLWEASRDASGTWQLGSQPRAKLGAGRPLGYHFDARGDLIVCNSLTGLVKYDYSSGAVTLLASHVSSNSAIDPGSQITYANDLTIAEDGTIFFTSCTDIIPPLNAQGFWDTFRAWFLGLMQGLPKGRLLRYDPKTQEAHVIAQGFYYANGVALSRDGSYVVMGETDRIRAHKIWVKGPKAGQSEVLIDNMPGMVDGVDEAHDGGFWISLVAPVPPFKSTMLSNNLASPLVRAWNAWLPARLRPGLNSWGGVVKVDGSGNITDFLMDPDGSRVATVSAVVEQELPDGGTRLWLGNLVGAYVSYIDLKKPNGGHATASSADAAPAGSPSRQGGSREL